MRAWTQGVRAWTEAFFRCEECRGHFLAELNSPAFAALASKRDAVLWIWEAHNRVNERIAGVRAPSLPPCLQTAAFAVHGPVASRPLRQGRRLDLQLS